MTSMVARMMWPQGDGPRRCPCVYTAIPFPLQLSREELSDGLPSNAVCVEKTHILGESAPRGKGQETQGTQHPESRQKLRIVCEDILECCRG